MVNTETPNQLSITQALWVVAIVIVWVLIFLGFLIAFPTESIIKPTLWLLLTAILVLIFSVKRYGACLKISLAMNSSPIRWYVVAVVMGVTYWLIDSWLTTLIFNQNIKTTIFQWHNNNEPYLGVSVFLSSVVLAPMFEELFFRGLIFKALLKRYNWIIGVFISALLFACIHWNWPLMISVFFAGLFYAVLTYKSASVFPAITAHITHNLITFSYYTLHS